MRSLFWFGLGGTTAYLLHKHNTDDEGRERWQKNCMKHSWGRRREERRRERELEAAPAFATELPPQHHMRAWNDKPDMEKEVTQASEKLISTVKSGVQSVLGMLTEMETAVNRQKALRAQQIIPHPGSAAMSMPTVAEASSVSVIPRDESTRSIPPTYTPGATISPATPDPSLLHILAEIEKLNARIDALSPPPKAATSSDQRLVYLPARSGLRPKLRMGNHAEPADFVIVKTLILGKTLASLISADVFAITTQQPLRILPANDVEKLGWTHPPSPDDTGNLVFNSLNGLLKHQPNALYRNGHAMIAGTVTPGTLLYHSSILNCTGLPPTTPEWVSFDPEHSYLFGSRMYTFQVVRPLKILYFDGSSAAKMPSGPMDTQEILAHGEIRDRGWGAEGTRIRELCNWGKEFGLDGFLRMEFDFEMMLCDFSVGIEVVSALDLLPVHTLYGPLPDCSSEGMESLDTADRLRDEHRRLWVNNGSEAWFRQAREDPDPPGNPPRRGPGRPGRGKPTPPPGWVGSLRPERTLITEAIQAGNWHDLPGLVHSVQLDYTRFVTFFDPKYESLMLARRGQTNKRAFRAGNVTKADAEVMLSELREMLRTWDITPTGRAGLRVGWSALVQSVVERYSTRLEYLLLLLSASAGRPHTFNATQARWQVLIMLAPYMPVAFMPSVDTGSDDRDSSWLAPTIRHCSSVYTSRIPSSTLTSSERLIKSSVETVAGEICRTLGVIWLEAFGVESKDGKEQTILMARWHDEVKRLMDWLGWANWADFVVCDPACSVHEFCTLPQWPIDMRNDDGSGTFDKPYCHSRGLDV
ncbi:hypothetical protein FRB97_001003 [Tulasnella sp. 331]|nr:hypothetical protein FRB97_001003 [Tulasnella sp. 331]